MLSLEEPESADDTRELIEAVRILADAIARDSEQCDADVERAAKLISQATQTLDDSFTRLSQQSRQQLFLQRELMRKVSPQAGSLGESVGFAGFVQAMNETIARFGNMVASYARETVRVNGMVADMAEHMDQLHRMIAHIDEIADETGHLAINAALEAARAGEAGRSFMVVSSQIRSLARKTKLLDIDITEALANTHIQSQKICEALEWMATQDLTPLVEAKDRSNEMGSRIEALEDEMADEISRAETLAANVHQLTGDAVRALQFEDIVSQILRAAAARQSGLPNRLTDQMTSIAPDADSTRLAQCIRKAAKGDATHMPAKQDSLDEGDLVLF